jgi:hypothetical protein
MPAETLGRSRQATIFNERFEFMLAYPVPLGAMRAWSRAAGAAEDVGHPALGISMNGRKRRFPALCPRCGSIFPSSIPMVPGRMVLEGNVENCPVCRYPYAAISEGIFRITNEAIQIVSAPDVTRAMLDALHQITKQAVDGLLPKEQAIERAAAVSPPYARLLEQMLGIGLPAAALLVAIVSVYLQAAGNRSSSEDAQKLLNAVMEQTYILKAMKDEHRIDDKSTAPSEKNTKTKSMPIKDPSKRHK